MSGTPDATRGEQRFGPTSGVAVGWIGLVLCAVALVGVLDADHSSTGVGVALGVILLGALIWCFMLRPRVVIGDTTLVLRNAISEWRVPLAGIQIVVVRAVTRVKTAHGRYDGVAVGRTVHAMMREKSGRQSVSVAEALPKGGQLGADVIPDFVVEQILHAADLARENGHVAGPGRRVWAVPELVLLTVLAAGAVISLLV